jgi:hypothetical protein
VTAPTDEHYAAARAWLDARCLGDRVGVVVGVSHADALAALLAEREAAKHASWVMASEIAKALVVERDAARAEVERVRAAFEGPKRLLDWLLMNDAAGIAPIGSGTRTEIRAVRDRLRAGLATTPAATTEEK